VRIKKHDWVLEVGSGDNPHPRSDVLFDKFVEDCGERESQRPLSIDDRPFIEGDAEHLPFPDKSFDYIIASHVLEHARHPKRFLDELARVGKAGYIETPSPMRERVFNWPFHRWYVEKKRGKLIIIKKRKTYTQLSELFHLEGRGVTNTKFEWKGNIDYHIYHREPKGFLEDIERKLERFYKKRRRDPFYWVQKIKAAILIIPGVAKAALAIKNAWFAMRRKKGNVNTMLIFILATAVVMRLWGINFGPLYP